jgi:RNA-directed DNA polymerase
MERRARRGVARLKKAPETHADGSPSGYARLDWIHSAAGDPRGEKMHNLMHHLNAHNLRWAFRSLDGSKATGIDHVTKSVYQQNLDENLAALERSIRGGGWRPRPAREVLIPKPQGGTRPLAIGCLEDKIVQTLVARILEAIYEPIFHRHSYGFRRGKSAHQALGRAYEVIDAHRRSCTVVEMDIEKFFNSVSHDWLMRALEQRIDDSHFLRLIRRLLRNSILHADGRLAETIAGTSQGSPASPVLANICLHYLLDDWFTKNWSDKGQFVRYADDAIFVFTDEQHALAFRQALTEHMAEAGLRLNEDKTNVVPFSANKPQGTISLLGFQLYWGVRYGSRKRTLKLKTLPKRLHRSMQAFYRWIKAERNRLNLTTLWRIAAQKLRGHYNYYGVIFNEAKLSYFHHTCIGALFKWINRRSQKRSYTWEQFMRRLLFHPLPRPPRGTELRNTLSEHGAERNHKPKSRMREIRKYGSVRSTGPKTPVFT